MIRRPANLLTVGVVPVMVGRWVALVAARWRSTLRGAQRGHEALRCEIDPCAGRARGAARLTVFALLAGLPLTKWAQLHWRPDNDALRQGCLVALCGVAVCLVARPGTRAQSVLTWPLVSPRPRPINGGVRHWLNQAVLWTLVPAVLVWAAVLGWNVLTGRRPLEISASEGCVLFYDSPVWRAGCVVVVIGIGEELLFRGLLLVLAVRARLDWRNFILVSLSFGAWHLPDDPPEGVDALLGRAAAFVATFLASHLLLFVLRLRSQTLAAPAALHASTNLSLLLVLP